MSSHIDSLALKQRSLFNLKCLLHYRGEVSVTGFKVICNLTPELPHLTTWGLHNTSDISLADNHGYKSLHTQAWLVFFQHILMYNITREDYASVDSSLIVTSFIKVNKCCRKIYFILFNMINMLGCFKSSKYPCKSTNAPENQLQMATWTN